MGLFESCWITDSIFSMNNTAYFQIYRHKLRGFRHSSAKKCPSSQTSFHRAKKGVHLYIQGSVCILYRKIFLSTLQTKILMFSLQGAAGCAGLPSDQIIMEKKNQIKTCMSWMAKIKRLLILAIQNMQTNKEKEKVRRHFNRTPVFSLTTHQTFFTSRREFFFKEDFKNQHRNVSVI